MTRMDETLSQRLREPMRLLDVYARRWDRGEHTEDIYVQMHQRLRSMKAIVEEATGVSTTVGTTTYAHPAFPKQEGNTSQTD